MSMTASRAPSLHGTNRNSFIPQATRRLDQISITRETRDSSQRSYHRPSSNPRQITSNHHRHHNRTRNLHHLPRHLHPSSTIDDPRAQIPTKSPNTYQTPKSPNPKYTHNAYQSFEVTPPSSSFLLLPPSPFPPGITVLLYPTLATSPTHHFSTSILSTRNSTRRCVHLAPSTPPPAPSPPASRTHLSGFWPPSYSLACVCRPCTCVKASCNIGTTRILPLLHLRPIYPGPRYQIANRHRITHSRTPPFLHIHPHPHTSDTPQTSAATPPPNPNQTFHTVQTSSAPPPIWRPPILMREWITACSTHASPIHQSPDPPTNPANRNPPTHQFAIPRHPQEIRDTHHAHIRIYSLHAPIVLSRTKNQPLNSGRREPLTTRPKKTPLAERRPSMHCVPRALTHYDPRPLDSSIPCSMPP